MRDAYSRLSILEADFFKTYRRRNDVELTLTSTSAPLRDQSGNMKFDERGRIRLSPEIVEIRVVYDDTNPEQVEQYSWFAARALKE